MRAHRARRRVRDVDVAAPLVAPSTAGAIPMPRAAAQRGLRCVCRGAHVREAASKLAARPVRRLRPLAALRCAVPGDARKLWRLCVRLEGHADADDGAVVHGGGLALRSPHERLARMRMRLLLWQAELVRRHVLRPALAPAVRPSRRVSRQRVVSTRHAARAGRREIGVHNHWPLQRRPRRQPANAGPLGRALRANGGNSAANGARPGASVQRPPL
mmetsp:Transcript_12164/g.42703  ORF Transcript_12164/g.42703 Transcript_12164/m.42703 type:complete len:216 (-) Transcript_12164:361-1008(-)